MHRLDFIWAFDCFALDFRCVLNDRLLRQQVGYFYQTLWMKIRSVVSFHVGPTFQAFDSLFTLYLFFLLQRRPFRFLQLLVRLVVSWFRRMISPNVFLLMEFLWAFYKDHIILFCLNLSWSSLFALLWWTRILSHALRRLLLLSFVSFKLQGASTFVLLQWCSLFSLCEDALAKDDLTITWPIIAARPEWYVLVALQFGKLRTFWIT